MELTFTREDIPKITRAGGSGREPEKWEEHLSPVKDTAGVSFRVWTYEKRTSAVSRMSAVRDRLSKAVPQENWKLAVRPVYRVGDGDEATYATAKPDGESVEHFGVYVQFDGLYTPEQMIENARLHQERSERVKNSRKSADDNGADADAPADSEPAPVDSTEPDAEPELTPKQKAQRAAAAQKA